MATKADVESLSGGLGRIRTLWVPILGLTALAAALRLIGLGAIPPGLYRDEAFNGLDALRILDGSFPLYFTANHGREPLFLYLVAGTVRVLGRTPSAVRLAAAICGILTVPATYLMTSVWFNRRTALLSAAIISTTVWHIQLSRTGFRAVMLPLNTAILLAAVGHAFNSGRPHHWLLTGLLYGLTLYTYTAARFTPVALLVGATYLFFLGRAERIWPGALYFAFGAVVALLPLGIYSVGHWDVVMGRSSQVSVLNPVVNHGELWSTLGRHAVRTLGMFFIRGDTIARHNVPGRPVFTPLVGAAMMLGAIQSGIRARRGNPGSALMLVWVVVMLVPTVAAADAPHFLRAVGVLPPLVVLPALGLEATLQAADRHNRQLVASVLVCLVLTFSLGATVRDYFIKYAGSSEAAYAFESAATELAATINRFTGVGWGGQGIAVSSRFVDVERRAYVDERLWQAWKAVSFLVPEQEALCKVQLERAPTLADQTLLLLWPHGAFQPFLSTLPHPARIEAHAGPLTRGDLEESPYRAYAAYLIEPPREETIRPLARFGESIDLVDYSVEKNEHAWTVRLEWRAEARLDNDYTAFIYLCEGSCAGGQLAAQHDGQPGDGYYPTSLWHPGDIVVDSHTLELPNASPTAPSIGVGFYTWPNLERLTVTSPSGIAPEDMLVLPVPE